MKKRRVIPSTNNNNKYIYRNMINIEETKTLKIVFTMEGIIYTFNLTASSKEEGIKMLQKHLTYILSEVSMLLNTPQDSSKTEKKK